MIFEVPGQGHDSASYLTVAQCGHRFGAVIGVLVIAIIFLMVVKPEFSQGRLAMRQKKKQRSRLQTADKSLKRRSRLGDCALEASTSYQNVLEM